MKKLVSFVAFFALSMTAFLTYAHAYIDPSAMTYLIQIIAGVVIACGAAFGFYWRKFKRALRRKKEDETVVDAAETDGVADMVEYADEEDLIDPNAASEEK